MDIAFVVLHYNAIKETIDCVESIQKNIDTDSYCIVIVDNNSSNNTGSILNDKYRNHERIKVIINKENLGFAKGNNVGIDYARNVLRSEYVCCLNNDTLLEQKDFFSQISHLHDEKHIAVIGPQVILKDNSVQEYGGG